jgi:acetyl-CoA C-acetyltransferase
MTDPIVIVGMARTPMGGLQGVFAPLSAVTLGAIAIRHAIQNAGVNVDDIDEVYMGCVLHAGVGQAPARQAALGAGLPKSTPCTTVSKVCGSGMKAIMNAHDALVAGSADIVVAGGMESMTNAPYLIPKGRSGYRFGHGEIWDHMLYDGLQDAYSGGAMGVFAEKCADHYGFTREEQDGYAITSLTRALSAIESGKFVSEIAPVSVPARGGDVTVDTDEQPGKASAEKIPKLKPAFVKAGTVTAANASSISDGASALVLTKRSVAQRKGMQVLATLEGHTQHANEPEWFTTAPVHAVRKLTEKLAWDVKSVELFEINEAFAVVPMAVMRDLDISHDQVNIYGGACALGHPIGSSGSRIVVTLINALRNENKRTGVATLCIGGGEATAMGVTVS